MTPDTLVNRELSWLEFNRRVLEEAQDESVPRSRGRRRMTRRRRAAPARGMVRA